MKARRFSFTLVALLIGSLSLPACGGHNEDEWNMELGKEKKLQSDLDAERQAHKQDKDDLDKAQSEIAQLKSDLNAYGAQLGDEKDKAAKLKTALDQAEQRAKVLEAAKARLDALKKKLDELKKFNLKVVVRHNQIVIELPGDVLFAPGSELLSKEGKEVLARVGEVIKSDPDLMKRFYQVIGHTDNTPYNGPFKDNVGLSLMRSREVYQFLTTTPDATKKPVKEGGGLPQEHWSAAGYGDLDPVSGTVQSQNVEDKKKNRRVEIAILPDASELMQLDAG